MIKVGASPSLSCSDVDNFEIPSGKLVIYLFNPFGEERMANLIAKLVPREEETLVIYHNPLKLTQGKIVQQQIGLKK